MIQFELALAAYNRVWNETKDIDAFNVDDVRRASIAAALCAVIEVHEARVTELLTHNNELLERARVAERRAVALQSTLSAAAQVIGALS